MTANNTTYLAQFHALLERSFDIEGIRQLCFELHVDHESIPGDAKPALIRNLLLALGRNGRLPELVELARRERPNTVWTLVPDDFTLPESLSIDGMDVPANQYNYYGTVVQGDYVQGNLIQGDAVQGDKIEAGTYIAGDQYLIQPEKQPGLFVNMPPMPRHFTGRDTFVEQLVEQLLSETTLAMAVEGLPGVGKTTLAIALAHHQAVLDHFSDGVLWGGLGHVPDVMVILGEWATALGGDVSAYGDPQTRRQAVQNLIGQQRLLLIIDDAWEWEAAEQLRCGGPNCCHILTTRQKSLARRFSESAGLYSVPTLEADPAWELLQQLAPDACKANPELARQLTEEVDGLPLGIELLGGYLADPNAPERLYFPTAIQTALETMTVATQRLQLAAHRLGDRGDKISLQATIELSVADLPPAGQATFYRLGAFAPTPATFTPEAALEITKCDERTLGSLIDRNLVQLVGAGQLALHQTVAEITLSQMPPETQEAHQAYYLTWVNEAREDWQRIERVYGQVQWAWQKAADNPEKLDLIAALRIYQRRRGLWRDYLAWLEKGLTICQHYNLQEDRGALLNNIGLVYNSLGDRQQALAYYNRALPICEEVGDREGLATTLSNIGGVYDALGDRQQALAYYKRALPIREEVGDREGLAITLNNIGLVYDSLGDRQQALAYYNRALPISEEVGDWLGSATTLNNIGLVYHSLGDRQQALAYYNRALPIYENVGYKQGLANTLNNIGGIYDNLEKWQQALVYYNRALPISEEVGDRYGQATTLNNIGAVYNSLGDWQQALTYYNRALLIQEEAGDQYGEITTRYSMAMLYEDQDDFAAAVAELQQVVNLDRLIQHPGLEADEAALARLEAKLAQQNEA